MKQGWRLSWVVLGSWLLGGAGIAHAEEGAEFTSEIQAIRRLVACDTRVPDADVRLPDGLSLKQVKAACKRVDKQAARFETRWLSKARPFFADLVPADVPKTVIYPFGGADLMNALTVYPNLDLLTTLSLEWVGDPRAILQLDAAQLRKNLAPQHDFVVKLFQVNHNRTIDLQALNQSPIPAPLVFGLKALAILGYEPVSVRWFRVADDGTLHMLTAADIAAFDATPEATKQLGRNQFFGNVEVRFKKAGAANAPIQTWRHIRANLGDSAFRGSGVEKYLSGLGEVAGMTKAASYLLWRDDFSGIRDILGKQVRWMVSDSTGLTPYQAKDYGLVQETWGHFVGNRFAGARRGEVAMMELWKEQPERPLPMTFGYPDAANRDHLLVTRRP